ncbi:SIR2 family protein [Acinetobacter baumannii]|nr:SIR2 family protein [Acinetobacter baumannii]
MGAGFSKNSETIFKKIPLWSDLINDLKKSLNLEYETDFLKIAQLYYLKYGEYQYYNKLKKYFEINLEPSEVHKRLFNLLPNLIVTTNWDCLLEHTATEEGLTYDVIVNDVDLVKSSYFHKIVKMHGDFQHHNIVFKEDDYLKYAEEFPLIENYIKSILSTHVVVFIGYSYSDVDLKLITKWIETKSKVTPPKYLFSSRYNEAEASYLKNHGIQFLNPKTDEESSVNDILIDFFDLISEKNELLKYRKIINRDNLSFSEKIFLMNILYQKIKTLDELEAIFPKQIKELFSNSTIEYHIGCYAFYLISDGILTTDHDDLVRRYYKLIHEIIEENRNSDNEITLIVRKIFNIFKKANILFVKFNSLVDSNYLNIKEYLGDSNVDEDSEYLTFSSKGEANDLIFSEKYEKLMEKSIDKISLNKKEGNFIALAINSFNNEVSQLARRSKIAANGKFIDNKKTQNGKSEIKVFKDYFDFYGLMDKKEYNFINAFLNFNILNDIYLCVNERKNINEERLKSIKNGGFSLDSNQTEGVLLIKSYLDFMYKNNIAMEKYKNVKALFKNHINYKLNLIDINFKKYDVNPLFNFSKEENGPKVEIDILDLFIFLNFTENKGIVKILTKIVEVLKRDESFKIEDFFEKDFDLKGYFFSCIDNLLLKESSNDLENVLNNLIVLSSVCDWESGGLLLDKFKEIFLKSNNSEVIESVNKFVAFNSQIFKSKNMDYSPYIDFVINLILQNKINLWGYRSLERGNLSNVFNYMSWRKDYSNIDLVQAFIHYLNSPVLSMEDRHFYSIVILPYLLYVSDTEVKEIIRLYIYDYLDGNSNEMKFELFLLCMLYDDEFLKIISYDVRSKYFVEFEKYCKESFRFKDYSLNNIVLSYAKEDGIQYDFFRNIKNKFNL